MHWRVVLMSVLVVGVLALCFFRPSQALPVPIEPSEPVASPPPAAAPEIRAQPQKPTPSIHSAPKESPSQPEETHVGMPSHPVTPAHQRIYRENNLIGDLNGAMDVADVAGLRRLLEQYRAEYPEDAHVLQDGYALIADCLEHPGAETSARAQRYYDEELASGLRRYIRRHCLEGTNR